jgi:hypothetical protein
MTGTHYTIFQTVMAFATIGWLAAFGCENYIGSQCNQTFSERAASNQAHLYTVELRNDKILSREKSLQSRSGEFIKKLDGPDSGQGSKQ